MIEKLSNAFEQELITDEFLLDVEQISYLWNECFKASDRSSFRSIYQHIDKTSSGITDPRIVAQLSSWKARSNLQTLRSVLEWDTEKGAFTTGELEILRKELSRPTTVESTSPQLQFAKIAARTLLTTLRRSSQILGIQKDGLKRILSPANLEHCFLVVPGAKGQINEEDSWEPIPNELADQIEEYRLSPPIAAHVEASQYLFFCVSTSGEYRDTTSADLYHLLRDWATHTNSISPRTGSQMNLSMTRIRHTGATQLAMQGYSRAVIQDILQHDNPTSAQYYIDSVGADFIPILERIDGRVGGRLSELKSAFFRGKIVSEKEVKVAPVLVPDLKNPVAVGSCGKNGNCPLNPLLSCYSCTHFLAFKEADHHKALNYIEEMAVHWHSAEKSSSRSKAAKDFDRLAAGVYEVISIIEKNSISDGA